MSRLSIVTAMCGAPDITREFLHHTVGRCEEMPELILVSNGSTAEELKAVTDEIAVVWERWGGLSFDGDEAIVLSYPDPLGSTKPLNLGLAAATGDVVAFLHNDLLVRTGGWDKDILAFFDTYPQLGVVGFHGSQVLGVADLYKVPYEKHQLARGGGALAFSNMEDAESHGTRSTQPVKVVTCDGMALIARRDDLLEWGGFDERYVHHMYDHDLCITARARGRVNYMYPISVRHVSGQTANFPRYNEAFASQGSDAGIHDASHLAFYEKWKGTGQLPCWV